MSCITRHRDRERRIICLNNPLVETDAYICVNSQQNQSQVCTASVAFRTSLIFLIHHKKRGELCFFPAAECQQPQNKETLWYDWSPQVKKYHMGRSKQANAALNSYQFLQDDEFNHCKTAQFPALYIQFSTILRINVITKWFRSEEMPITGNTAICIYFILFYFIFYTLYCPFREIRAALPG